VKYVMIVPKAAAALFAVPVVLIYAWVLFSFTIMTSLPPLIFDTLQQKAEQTRRKSLQRLKTDMSFASKHVRDSVRAVYSWVLR